MVAVHEEGDALAFREFRGDRYARRRTDVAQRTQLHGVVPEGIHHHADILGRTESAVLLAKDRRDDKPRFLPAERLFFPEAVEEEVRRIVALGLQRGLVLRPDERRRPVPLVEAQAGDVLLSHGIVPAQRRVVGEAFEEDADASKVERLLPDPLVEDAPEAAPRFAPGDGDIVQVAELQQRVVEDEGKTVYFVLSLLRDEEYRLETVLQVIRELLGDRVRLAGTGFGELLPQDLLNTRNRPYVRRGACVENPPDAEHPPVAPYQAGRRAFPVRETASSRSTTTAPSSCSENTWEKESPAHFFISEVKPRAFSSRESTTETTPETTTLR